MADPTDKLAKTIEDTKAFVDKANEKMDKATELLDENTKLVNQAQIVFPPVGEISSQRMAPRVQARFWLST